MGGQPAGWVAGGRLLPPWILPAVLLCLSVLAHRAPARENVRENVRTSFEASDVDAFFWPRPICYRCVVRGVRHGVSMGVWQGVALDTSIARYRHAQPLYALPEAT
jgi:hypothetical protein